MNYKRTGQNGARIASILSGIAPLTAHAGEDTDALVKQLIDLYKDGQENAADEIEETLTKLKKEDQQLGETWENIMNYWSYVNTEMEAHKTGGEPIEIIASAGYGTGSEGYESIALQASGVASVAGMENLATMASGVGIDIYKVGMVLAAVLVLIVVIIVLAMKKRKRRKANS